MIETVKALLFPDHRSPVVYECRQCGTTVDSEDVNCPFCDSDDIVRIQTR